MLPKSFSGANSQKAETATTDHLEEMRKLIDALSGASDQIVMDKKSFEANKNIFKKYLNVPEFETGEWVFDGLEMFEVIEQNGERIEVARIVNIFGKCVLAIRNASDLKKIPKGATLETIKILFGKVK